MNGLFGIGTLLVAHICAAISLVSAANSTEPNSVSVHIGFCRCSIPLTINQLAVASYLAIRNETASFKIALDRKTPHPAQHFFLNFYKLIAQISSVVKYKNYF